jgi:hypothetical protein
MCWEMTTLLKETLYLALMVFYDLNLAFEMYQAGQPWSIGSRKLKKKTAEAQQMALEPL